MKEIDYENLKDMIIECITGKQIEANKNSNNSIRQHAAQQ